MEWIKANWLQMVKIMAVVAILILMVKSITTSRTAKEKIKELKEDRAHLQDVIDDADIIIQQMQERIDILIESGEGSTRIVKDRINNRKNEEEKEMERIRNSGIHLLDSTAARLNRHLYTRYPFDPDS